MNNRPRCKRITTPPHKRVVVPNHGPENGKKRYPKKNTQTRTPQVHRHQPETITSLPGVKTNYNQHRTDSARRTRLPSVQCRPPSPSPIPNSTGGLNIFLRGTHSYEVRLFLVRVRLSCCWTRRRYSSSTSGAWSRCIGGSQVASVTGYPRGTTPSTIQGSAFKRPYPYATKCS